jgi:outer membrane murein-binding lipoprotein Lpp
VATERADELAEQVERLRTKLAAAEEAETAARQEARTARRRVSELEGSVQDARDALDAL